MKIQKSQLKKALEIVMPGLATNDNIEGATSFCFMDGNVVTYNDEISVACPIPDLDITGAVNASELYTFLNKVKGDEINLEVTENELLFKVARAKAGLTLQTDIKLPVEELGELSKWKKLPDDFLKAVSFAMAACSRDSSKPVLTCVHVNGDVVEASDNYRITHFTLEDKVNVPEFLIPAASCRAVLKMKPIKIAKSEGWAHFKAENGAVLSCRLFEDKFPSLAPHIKVKGASLVFPKSIEAILDRASIFAKRDRAIDENILIEVSEKKMEIKSDSATGWFSERAKAEYEGDSISFKITPYLLKDILKETNHGTLSKTKLLFEGENWKYLTMLKI